MRVKAYRRSKLATVNAERLARGEAPILTMRGRRGVWVPGVTEKPPLVDLPIAGYRSEQQEGLAVQSMVRGQWWALHLCHLPLEGGRGKDNKIRGQLAKAQGARPGTPDYVLPILQTMKDGRTLGGLWIELKAVDGKPSEAQLEWAARATGAGQAVCFAYGADAVITAIRVYLSGDWPSAP